MLFFRRSDTARERDRKRQKEREREKEGGDKGREQNIGERRKDIETIRKGKRETESDCRSRSTSYKSKHNNC